MIDPDEPGPPPTRPAVASGWIGGSGLGATAPGALHHRRRRTTHLRLVADPAVESTPPAPPDPVEALVEPARCPTASVPPGPVPTAQARVSGPVGPAEPVLRPPPRVRTPSSPAPAAPLSLRRELVLLVAVLAVGAAVAVTVDLIAGPLIGGVDGQPSAYLLVFLALPVWDLLPRRLPARIAVVAADTAVVAAVWWVLARLPVPGLSTSLSRFWPGDLAFVVACLVAGLAHLGVLGLGRCRVAGRPIS